MRRENGNTIGNTKISIIEIIRRYGFRRALVFVFLALFFSALILIYNTVLGNYVRNGIRAKNEINALNSAQEVEIYLSTGKDIIGVTQHAVTDLIKENASDEAILDYLTEQTHVIQNSVLPASTGIYGCIRGKYFDGSGWEPEEGYVPQERPWYTEAVEDVGETVLINPYFDLYSNEFVMTIAKSLSDGENVVAVDITLGRIQEITEMNSGTGTESGLNTSRIVVSNNGFVVAHSDSEERGHNYLEEKGTFGNLILMSILEDEDDYSEIEYRGHKYTVYGVPIGNGWYGISVVDARNEYRAMYTLFATSAFALLATFIIFTIIMLRTGRRELLNDKLQSVLGSSADIYMSLCDLDVINNTVEGIKNVNPAVAKAVESCDHNMKELFLGIMQALPESPTKQAAIDFTDLNTIDERMKDTDTSAIEYLSYGDIWVRARLVVSERTKDNKVSHVLWMLENIDEEKKERDRLVDLSEKALAASEAKSSFLSNMSHEIRTPINAILGMNEVALRECEDDNIKEYLNNIQSSGHTLLELVNDILDVSKIESGKLEIIPVEYELSFMLNDLINMIRPRLEHKGLELIVDIDKTIPQSLYGDDVRIKQVITNILTNAVKYTEKGSITFKMEYKGMGSDENSIMLHVAVKDTGIGIKKEDINKLFVEFERIEEKRNRNIEGTGLGMAITKTLLELMNSSLKVESTYGEGSEFSFDIVQEVRDWTPIGNYESAYRNSIAHEKIHYGSFTAPDARILVVDDTPMNLLVFTSLLEPTKIVIDTADNGDDGIKNALGMKYDLIFFDHMMPHKDGIETLKELKSYEGNINWSTPIVCLTANAITGAREQYIEAGFDDYLTKPIDSRKLEEMIVKYLPRNKIMAKKEEISNNVKKDNIEEDTVSHLPEYLFSIRDLDPVDGMKRCGSEKIYLDALNAFARYVEPTIKATHGYLYNKDMKDVMINVHSIKTASKLVGATHICDMAQKIENAGEEGFNVDALDELFDRCMEMKGFIMQMNGN